jgi:hypothetical protein
MRWWLISASLHGLAIGVVFCDCLPQDKKSTGGRGICQLTNSCKIGSLMTMGDDPTPANGARLGLIICVRGNGLFVEKKGICINLRLISSASKNNYSCTSLFPTINLRLLSQELLFSNNYICATFLLN